MNVQLAQAPATDPLWYRDAVIYEVHVRAFFDSNGDGIGDFRGLVQKLDYIQDLGVNTIWLLPFYVSPGRDDGYDIADYRNIHPDYGTRADFANFVREAHRRGLRVITELVVNHTSDQHPWFEAARRAPPKSAKRNFYVWSENDSRYAGTRIIFTDSETSNWAWDPVAKSYYWHRFFRHQPDLNFDNPHVERAILRIMRFWLDQGVDGLRLDAVPYLVEREGTSNENLRETHEVVKRIRKVIDESYGDRMLLAEANMWPEDVRDYFADGDECHMAYHFPLMPRMYMAIAQEDRHPIVEIVDQTPDIPDNCQWAIFLRNHDELTLEMVTSRERDYMYQMYASDARARINLGIRRRLAPLMENDGERIKLMNSLLLSMPGSPIIYYGDEIGMGDNIYLGDRNGVRTPMQWSPDRNAGFSRADPQRLYLPPIMDPIYGYEAVNVEAQLRDRSSMLNWMKRMLSVRKGSHAFGRGTLRFIRPGNRKILVYLREHGDDVILCVANLARSAQPVTLDLAEFKGTVPIELLGRTPFPTIGDLPYFLTLPGYAFYWFRLSRDAPAPEWHDDRLPREDVPVLVLIDGWNSFWPQRAGDRGAAATAKLHAQLETRVLPAFIAAQRWFGGKGTPIDRARIVEHCDWSSPQGHWVLAMLDVETNAHSTTYFVPLVMSFEDDEESRFARLQPAAVARCRQQAKVGVLADATGDEAFGRTLVDAIAEGKSLRMGRGTVTFSKTRAFAELAGDAPRDLTSALLMTQGSNTTLRIGERLFLKLYRRLQPGRSTELEIGKFLTDVAQFPHVVPLAGAFEYRGDDGVEYTLGLLQSFVTNQGDAWHYTVNYLARFLEDRRPAENEAPADVHGAFLTLVRTLGRRTGELHAAFALSTPDPAFGAEPITSDDLARWRDRAGAELHATLDMISRPESLPQAARELGALVLQRRAALESIVERVLANGRPPARLGVKIRLHGDYHLGQVLLRRNDFIIVDFEGEPARPLAERAAKGTPMRDVAGMLRSFNYARHAAIERSAAMSPEDRARCEGLLDAWEAETRKVFIRAYDRVARPTGLYPELDGVRGLLTLSEIEKALYELRYELQNRPEFATLPLTSLLTLGS
jgi:maltose alpha-D-glucosyltransferase / alpha-amylase